MAGLRDYTAEELDGELLDLFATHRKISSSELLRADDFLENLRSRALHLTELDKIESL